MNVLLLTDPGVKSALQHEALRGLPRIGRGKFSAVFDKGETVMRLTVDPVAYELHNVSWAPNGIHFGKLTNGFGQVSEMSWSNGEFPIYLFETEKLEPLRVHLQARRLASKIMKAASWARSEVLESRPSMIRDESEVSVRVLDRLVNGGFEFPDSMIDAFEQLGSFAGAYEHTSLDFHAANFMVRPGCGTLVLNDPLVDLSKMQERHLTLSRGAA